MAVLRLAGRHLKELGRPRLFRTETGLTAHDSIKNVPLNSITSIFSRKDEIANLEAVRIQHNTAFAAFDASQHNTLHVTNNLPYIHRMNEGWSTQSAAGFFERAVYEAQKAVRGLWKVSGV